MLSSNLCKISELITSLIFSTIELDEKLASNATDTARAQADLLRIMLRDYGGSLTVQDIQNLVTTFVPRNFRMTDAEVTVRGDIKVGREMSADAEISINFIPASLSLGGAYSSSSQEQWGIEIKTSVQSVPPDSSLFTTIANKKEMNQLPVPTPVEVSNDPTLNKVVSMVIPIVEKIVK